MRPQPRAPRPAALAALALVLAVTAQAADGFSLDELLARLRAHTHRHANFTERYASHVLDRPLEATGELFYDAPDRLEKRTLTPRAERMVLDHGTLTLERRHRSLQTSLAAHPEAAPYIDSIRATLAGDRAALERVFRVEFAGTEAEWTLTLAPLAVRGAASAVQQIRIDGAGDDVRVVTIELGNGDATRMTLSNSSSD
jgi:outer membrane lipoprotein-sorting protein